MVTITSLTFCNARSLEHTESEEKVARSKESALIQKIDRLQSMLQEAVQERQKLEAESALSISNEETVSQAVRKIRKKTNEMVKELHIQEVCHHLRCRIEYNSQT